LTLRSFDKDHGWKAFIRRLREIRKLQVKVGLLGTGKNTRQKGEATNVEIGLVHEFGSPKQGIPERSFIRSTFDARRAEYAAMARRLLPAVISGRSDARRALGLIGAKASADIKNTVTQGPHIPPPLKPATVARKGSDRPLVDTNQMVNAVAWAVEAKR
jgi:hypothetical protein